MLALAYSFSLFAFWSVVGRAAIALAYPRFAVLRAWLVSPAIGVSVLLLTLMTINQAGVPLRHAAVPATVVLAIVAVGVLAWRRPIVPWRKGWPFLLATLGALLWVAWPAFATGFNWVSYANDDMANYCLAAQRFLDNGFYQVPTLAQFQGRDYATYYYFMHVGDMMRFGAEHLVAWGAALAGIKATQSFMPVIVALALLQLCSAGALVLHTGRRRRLALATMWLLAISPLFLLGTLYQVIAQVGGIALMMTTVALLLRPSYWRRRKPVIRYAVLPALTASALCIFYPEVTPFAALTVLAYAALWIVRKRQWPAGLFMLVAYTLATLMVLLRSNVIAYVHIFLLQFNGAMQSANLLISLFPYFMLPTGFSNLFGFMPIAHDFAEPFLSGSIALGMVLALVIVIRSVRPAWRMEPIALLLLIDIALALQLFRVGNDFGLYKMAMYMQPPLMAGLAAAIWWAARRRWLIAVAGIAVYILATVPTALHYTDASRGLEAGGLTELPLASEAGLHLNLPADRHAQIAATIENVVAAKFAASESRGHLLTFLSRDFFAPVIRTDFKHPTWAVKIHPHYAQMEQAPVLMEERNARFTRTGVLWRTQVVQPVLEQPIDYYVSVSPQLSLFNKFDASAPSSNLDSVFVVEPASQVHNRLLFVHSGLGNHYYLGDRSKISFFQLEADPFAPGHEFNAVGRFMLLRVENPSPKLYVRIAATRTLVTGRTAWSPRAVVRAGSGDLPLHAVGNGAFNLFIGPLVPRTFEGARYVAIDFAEIPKQLRDRRTGLKRLYNRNVVLDYRRLLGWARDVSVISDTEFAALQRPREISNFPQDLALARTLEFAGAYEDGWLSPHARFVMAGAAGHDVLRIRGMVPEVKGSPLGTGTVGVSVNGVHVADLAAPLGTFDWLLPVPNPGPTTTVDLQFTATALLPSPDERPVGAKLEYLGLVAPAVLESSYDSATGPRLAASGIDGDGWMQHRASIIIPASAHDQEVSLRFEYPDWGGATRKSLEVQVARGSAPTQLQLVPGTEPTLRVHVPAATTPTTLELQTTGEIALPAPDHRRRAVRLSHVVIAPADHS